MPYKLLLTGRYTTIIDTFFDHLTEFHCMTTSTRFDDLKRHMELFHPDALVVCLSNEDPAVLTRISTLMGRYAENKVGVVIIGEDEECAEFQKKTGALADKEIHKPLSPAKIQKLLRNFFEDRKPTKWGDEDNAASSASAPKKQETETEKLMRILQSVDEELADMSPSSDPLLAEVLNNVAPQTAINSMVNSAMQASPQTPMQAAPQAAPQAVAPQAAVPHVLSSETKHILVIDDDPLMLKVIKDYLHDQYDVATAKGGKIAYKFLEKKHTDLILLDYEMPDEDGPTVYQKIREMPNLQDVPILFLTGVSDKSRIMSVLALKPQGYLLKPIDYETLISTITPILKKR